MSRTKVSVRALEPDDLDQVIRIDERLTGQTRKDYWKKRFELSALRPPWMSLVAELDQRVVGFLFGWTSESEFGIHGPTGWIDLIGVDPPYRGRGVGQALVERFLSAGRELRAIDKVYTLIDLAQADVREFFTKLGFRHGPMIQLEREVTG
jgi:GNAT superfamily N-acetyltransferase